MSWQISKAKKSVLHWNLMPCKNKFEKWIQRQHIPEKTKKEVGAASVTEWKNVFLLSFIWNIKKKMQRARNKFRGTRTEDSLLEETYTWERKQRPVLSKSTTKQWIKLRKVTPLFLVTIFNNGSTEVSQFPIYLHERYHTI